MDVLETNKNTYERWANNKLESFTSDIDDLLVEISDPARISKGEMIRIKKIINAYNMVFYEFTRPIKNTQSSLIKLMHNLNIKNFVKDSKSNKNGITAIELDQKIMTEDEYIPYTKRSLNWHTDGYYNKLNKPIYSWILHCKQRAKNGGVNTFFDHEIIYILFNQLTNKILSLMDNEIYIIPENKKNGRKEIKSYVFSYDNPYKKLHMRFTMRERNIKWKKMYEDEIEILKNIIEKNSKYKISYKLQPGQGVITNNVIHSRTAFTNDINHHRLIYRIRSTQRINL